MQKNLLCEVWGIRIRLPTSFLLRPFVLTSPSSSHLLLERLSRQLDRDQPRTSDLVTS